MANRAELLGDDGEVAQSFDGMLTTDGAYKAAEFVDFCDAFESLYYPLVDVKGFRATVEEEKTIARACAKLTYAFASATVPKVRALLSDRLLEALILR